MLWKKPANIKYTEMCQYIDANVPIIANAGQSPEVEDRVYNWLWLLVKALAIKKRLFDSFSDYDPYCFYAAERLFFALRKNYLNQGKVIKGKEIRPIKSCLNYTKKLLYPMKIEYQRQSYQTVISEEWVSKKFDAFQFKEQLKEDARSAHQVSNNFWIYTKDIIRHSSSILDDVLKRSPFNKDSIDYKYLKITILLNCYISIKNKGKLDDNPLTIIMWKLPKSMANYVRVWLREFYAALKREILACYEMVNIDDLMLEKIISGQGESNDSED